MEDVKALGEKFVRVCVSVIVYLARGIRSIEAAGLAQRAQALFSSTMIAYALIAYHIVRCM